MKKNNERILIIDVGNYSIKAGFAGDGFPKLILPSLVKKDLERNITLVGNSAIEKKSRIFYLIFSKSQNC
jgi:actin-related protein